MTGLQSPSLVMRKSENSHQLAFTANKGQRFSKLSNNPQRYCSSFESEGEGERGEREKSSKRKEAPLPPSMTE